MPVKHPEPGDLEPIETRQPRRAAALQLQRLKHTLQHAYDNVPHYRRAFDAAGVHPSDCKSLADLAKFPFTSQGRPARQLPLRHVRRAARAGGARPCQLAAPPASPRWWATRKRDIDTWADLVARSIRAAGGRAGDMVHVAYGYGLFTGGLGAHYGAERLGCTVVPMCGGQTEKQVQLIADFRPDIIMVTPSYMQVIVEEMRAPGPGPARHAR